jgi:hypothetical protein
MTDENGYLEMLIRWNPKTGHFTAATEGLQATEALAVLELCKFSVLRQMSGGAGGPDTKRGIQVNVQQPGLQVRRIP